jgi:hypothetical protein
MTDEYQEERTMTRKIAAGCFAAMFGLAVSAGAQTPPSTPQTPPSTPPSSPTQPPSTPTSPYPSSQSADRAGKDTKLTGCIAAGTAAGSFELTNVKKGMPSDAPSAGGAAASKTVKLMASPSVDLQAHVGHTVELSGKWAAGGADSPSASPSTPPSAGASPSSGGKEFQVSAVKMVSSSCTAGTN